VKKHIISLACILCAVLQLQALSKLKSLLTKDPVRISANIKGEHKKSTLEDDIALIGLLPQAVGCLALEYVSDELWAGAMLQSLGQFHSRPSSSHIMPVAWDSKLERFCMQPLDYNNSSVSYYSLLLGSGEKPIEDSEHVSPQMRESLKKIESFFRKKVASKSLEHKWAPNLKQFIIMYEKLESSTCINNFWLWCLGDAYFKYDGNYEILIAEECSPDNFYTKCVAVAAPYGMHVGLPPVDQKPKEESKVELLPLE
jgi:hypothetical protein